jgi:hypothetical protein
MNPADFNPLDYPLCFSAYDERFLCSAWIEHVPFSFALAQMLRPRTFVELGTYAGASYCAFCEAVRQLLLDTRCFAVDTWHGDEHAGYYAESVYQELKTYHDPRYANFSHLMRETFDQAANKFNEASIDLLHIDGLHTYEAVKHDFETWLPKMSSTGVVLFHDISERSGDFGVWKCWEELKTRYPAFEFVHGHGLGLLFVGTDMPPDLESLCHATTEQQQSIRLFYSSLGGRFTKELSLIDCRKDVEEQRTHIHAQGEIIKDQQKYIEAQKNNLQDQQRYIEAQKNNLQDQQRFIEEQGRTIEEQGRTIEEQGRTIEEQGRTIEERDLKIDTLLHRNQLAMDQMRSSYESSSSWRVTRPLRVLSASLSKIRKLR